MIDLQDNIIVDTGFRCSICYEVARVLSSGESMCVKHAKEWSHGYGKNIKQMKEELDD